MYMLNMVIILIVMYCNVVTAIDKIPTYLLRFNSFVFIWRSVKRSPLASVLGSFFVKYAKSVSCWCQSFDYKFVSLCMGTPPLQMLKIEIDGN